jgi:hypothetical protein
MGALEKSLPFLAPPHGPTLDLPWPSRFNRSWTLWLPMVLLSDVWVVGEEFGLKDKLSP